MNQNSFTAASTLPAKLISNPELIQSVISKKIKPAHIQINPTNKCPLNCSFCSCKNLDRELEIDFVKLKKILAKFIELGTKAVTITGGGDPLAYSQLDDLLLYLYDNKVDIGFVTNGILFKKINKEIFQKITWCRISCSDEFSLPEKKLDNITYLDIDWSFSYVVTKKFNLRKLIRLVEYANKRNFTHIRLVNDIVENKTISVDEIQKKLSQEVDDTRVIYQGRKAYSKGTKRCLISLLKPNIDATGNIFPCCGIQYAVDPPPLTFDTRFSLGTVDELDEIYISQRYFDGSICDKCYYSEYNSSLQVLWDSVNLKHKNFI